MKKLPDFLIAGAQKSGTTSLHYYLKQHPDIFMGEHSSNELHFFDDPENWQKGIDWYKSFFTGAKSDKIMGQTSPLYIYLDYTPKRIYDLLPNVKLIFILRNPVERAYSHYWHEWKKNRENKNFNKAIQKETEKIKKSFWHKRNYSYLTRGNYATQLKRYLKYFPSSQIKIIIYDEFKKNSAQIIRESIEFLGLDQNFEINYKQKHNITKRPKNRFIKKVLVNRFSRKIPFLYNLNYKYNVTVGYPEMGKKMRNALISYYYDEICKLEKIVNKDLSYWKK